MDGGEIRIDRRRVLPIRGGGSVGGDCWGRSGLPIMRVDDKREIGTTLFPR